MDKCSTHPAHTAVSWTGGRSPAISNQVGMCGQTPSRDTERLSLPLPSLMHRSLYGSAGSAFTAAPAAPRVTSRVRDISCELARFDCMRTYTYTRLLVAGHSWIDSNLLHSIFPFVCGGSGQQGFRDVIFCTARVSGQIISAQASGQVIFWAAKVSGQVSIIWTARVSGQVIFEQQSDQGKLFLHSTGIGASYCCAAKAVGQVN